MDVSTKEQAKALLGYSQVPYYVVIGKDGHVIGHGDAKSLDVTSLVLSAKNENMNKNKISTEIASSPSTDAISFDEDF
jgi:hypothetical protein